MFGRRDMARIEREFLDVLDFKLRVEECDLLRYSQLQNDRPFSKKRGFSQTEVDSSPYTRTGLYSGSAAQDRCRHQSAGSTQRPISRRKPRFDSRIFFRERAYRSATGCIMQNCSLTDVGCDNYENYAIREYCGVRVFDRYIH